MSDYFPDRHNQLTIIGTDGATVARVDSVGGVRLRSTDGSDVLVGAIDDQGYTLRSKSSGLVGAEIRPGTFRLVDPDGVADIEMVTSSAGTLPNPVYKSAPELNPGSTLVAPAAPVFTTTPAGDLAIDHAVAWKRAVNQAATMTPPGSHTEVLDDNFPDNAGTLQVSVATEYPADVHTATFTSSQSNWDHGIGTHVVIKGGGASPPSVRSISTLTAITTDSAITLSIPKPTGAADTDALVAFVSAGTNGGGVPGPWNTPDDFPFLGANVSISGSGVTQSSCASGVWVKRLGASEPSTYQTDITLPPGTKMLHVVALAIQNAFLIPGGVQLRMSGHPTRQLLFPPFELQTTGTVLCDITNIPQAYDNLELVYDTTSTNTGTSTQELRIRFNGDTGTNYFRNGPRTLNAGAPVTQNDLATTRIRFGGLNHQSPSNSGGRIDVLGYTRVARPIVLGQTYWADGVIGTDLHWESFSGQWAGAAAINRITVEVDVAGPVFAAGSRAFLYGY